METAGVGQDIEREVLILTALREIVPNAVERDFPGIQTCVLTARVGLEVLRHFGIKARPVPVWAYVFNEHMRRMVNEMGRYPADQREMREWWKKHRAWTLGVGRTGQAADDRFDAHLVLMTHRWDDSEGDGGVLIDLALGQVSRPQRRIYLEPVVATVPDGFMDEEKLSPLLADSGNNNTVRYQFYPEKRGEWTHFPDWADQHRRDPIIRRSIEKIDAKLDPRRASV